MWSYYRDQYHSRRSAVEAFRPDMLGDPRIAAAVIQIEMAERYIDSIMTEQEEEFE